MSSARPTIAITGVGLVTSLGLSAADTWKGVLEGCPRLGLMPAMELPVPPSKGGYQAPDLPEEFAAGLPREVRYLRWTIQQALDDAAPIAYPPERCGFVLGTTLHGMRAGGRFLRTGHLEHLRSFLAGSTLDQAVAGLPLTGQSITTCSACSSSLGSIALAMTLLETGELDLVVSGGYDTVSEYAYAGFNSLRLVADGLLRPFCKNRSGMKLGEGYGVVILERKADAEHRGKKPLAIVLGCGESADAHHLTQPHPDGTGAVLAIEGALSRAGIRADRIDLIAAHATGTPDNDAGEYAAFSRVFADDLTRVPVVAFKSHVGHTLGGAGAVELILSAMALRDQVVPACANVKADDLEFAGLAVVTDGPRRSRIRATMNTSLGFGGANTCAILASPEVDIREVEQPARREVHITGIGIVLPGAVGTDAFQQLLQTSAKELSRDANSIAESEYLHLLSARRIRRMSDYVKMTLAATTLALNDSGVTDVPAFVQNCSAILGSTHAGSNYCADYYRQIVAEGMIAANPMLFAEGVPNAAAAHLSLMLSLKGSCQTVIGSRTAGLDALRLAWLRIASGQWERAIVSAGEEFHAGVNEAYGHCGLHGPNGFWVGAGAVTLLLESSASIETRGGKSKGQIAATSSRRFESSEAIEQTRCVLHELNDPKIVYTSANHTWVDRTETAAIRGEAEARSLYGVLPEIFSVGPLASIAAGLLAKQSFGVLCTGYNGTVAGVCIEESHAHAGPRAVW